MSQVGDLLTLYRERGASFPVRISQQWTEVGYLDPGMIADVVAVRDAGWGIEVTLDATEHIEYNRPLERNDWLKENGTFGTIREAREDFTYRTEIVIPKKRRLSQFFVSVDPSTFEAFSLWKERSKENTSGSTGYIDWLERIAVSFLTQKV